MLVWRKQSNPKLAVEIWEVSSISVTLLPHLSGYLDPAHNPHLMDNRPDVALLGNCLLNRLLEFGSVLL